MFVMCFPSDGHKSFGIVFTKTIFEYLIFGLNIPTITTDISRPCFIVLFLPLKLLLAEQNALYVRNIMIDILQITFANAFLYENVYSLFWAFTKASLYGYAVI